MPHPLEVIQTPSGSPDQAVRAEVASLLAVLAHELRNPLASLQGCAHTLVDNDDRLAPEVRRDLASVMVENCQRLTWLIEAAASMGGGRNRHPAEHPFESIVIAAAQRAGVQFQGTTSTILWGDLNGIRLAIEAILMALGPEKIRMKVEGDRLEISSEAHDLVGGGRGWKIAMAETLLTAEGADVKLHQNSNGTSIGIRFLAAVKGAINV